MYNTSCTSCNIQTSFGVRHTFEKRARFQTVSKINQTRAHLNGRLAMGIRLLYDAGISQLI